MATNAEVIGDALRDISVLGETDSVSAEQGAYGLRVLNDLMASWVDVDLGYFAQTDTTADCPVPAWAKLGVTTALAIAMAPNYGKSIPPELVAKAQMGYEPIARQAALDNIQPLDSSHLPAGIFGRLGRWDIARGF